MESEAELIRQAIAAGQRLIKLQYDSLLASLTPLWVPTKLRRQFSRSYLALDAMIRRMIDERRMAPHLHDDVPACYLPREMRKAAP